MFSSGFQGAPQREWAAASSPSPAAAVGRHQRTPRDDAPPYDPVLWSDTDNAYISTLGTHVMLHAPAAQPQVVGGAPQQRGHVAKPPLEKFLSSSWNEPAEATPGSRLSKFHAVHDRTPASLLGRVLQFISAKLFSRWHESVTPDDVMKLSTKELIDLMQLTLSAGELDRAAQLARELARRRPAVQIQTLSDAARRSDDPPRAQPAAPPPPPPPPPTQPSPVPQPMHVPRGGTFAPMASSERSEAGQWRSTSPLVAPPLPQRPASQPRVQPNVYTAQPPVAAKERDVRRPAPVDTTAAWHGEASYMQPPQVTRSSVDRSPNVSDINASSARRSWANSPWMAPPPWSGS